jgi:hypothetical protein
MDRNVYGLPQRGTSTKPIGINPPDPNHLDGRLRLTCPECGRDSDHLDWKTGNDRVPIACPLCHKAPGVLTVKPKLERYGKAVVGSALGLGIAKAIHWAVEWIAR